MMSNQISIEIAKDFSPYPAGRDEGDGPFHGQKFRKEILLPKFNEALQKRVMLVVHLLGVKSFGSSFLEESFGGLIRNEHVNKADLKRHLKIVEGAPENLRYKTAIERYIRQA